MSLDNLTSAASVELRSIEARYFFIKGTHVYKLLSWSKKANQRMSARCHVFGNTEFELNFDSNTKVLGPYSTLAAARTTLDGILKLQGLAIPPPLPARRPAKLSEVLSQFGVSPMDHSCRFCGAKLGLDGGRMLERDGPRNGPRIKICQHCASKIPMGEIWDRIALNGSYAKAFTLDFDVAARPVDRVEIGDEVYNDGTLVGRVVSVDGNGNATVEIGPKP